eukprot:3309145-Rhodomonas_salina.1
MAVEPLMMGAYRQAHENGSFCTWLDSTDTEPRVRFGSQENKWRWVWDASTKQGKWELGGDKGKKEEPKQPAETRGKITMEQLEDEHRRATDDRAAQLRRESARRLKQKEAQARKKEIEEHER